MVLFKLIFLFGILTWTSKDICREKQYTLLKKTIDYIKSECPKAEGTSVFLCKNESFIEDDIAKKATNEVK